MGLKAKIEAIIYAAEEPITLEQISLLVKDIVLAEEAASAQKSDDQNVAEDVVLTEESVKSGAESVAETDQNKDAAPELDSAIAEPAGETSLPSANGTADASAGKTATNEKPAETKPADAKEPPDISEADIPGTFAKELTANEPEPAALVPESEPKVQSSALTSNAPESELTLQSSESAARATESEPEPLSQASVVAPEPGTEKRRKPAKESKKDISPLKISEDARVKARVRAIVEELITDYAGEERGMEIRQVASGFRLATKPEHHDVVRAFARSLKPPIRLSLAALETLAVVAYKQPVTAPEITEIRGVETAGVLGTLLDRKLITTAGRKQVIGRPILYKTSKEFLLRFGLNDLSELPSMEEFEKLASDGQVELFRSSTERPAEETTPDSSASAPEEATLEGSAATLAPATAATENSAMPDAEEATAGDLLAASKAAPREPPSAPQQPDSSTTDASKDTV